MKYSLNLEKKISALLSFLALFVAVGIVAFAWTNPLNIPPGGTGALKVGTGAYGGRVGIGLSGFEQPVNTLTVKGNVSIGSGYVSQAANSNGLIVQGFTGVGTSTPSSPVTIAGGVTMDGINLQFNPARLPAPNIVTIVDPADSTFDSLTIGSDGLPIAVYLSRGELRIAKCRVIDCGSFYLISPGEPSVGYVGLAIGSDGFPVISHLNGKSHLAIYKCNNVDCSQGTASDDVSARLDNMPTSITIGSDGFPIIAYAQSSQTGFTACASLDCSSVRAQNIVDNAFIDGRYISLALGSDGLPFMSYQEVDHAQGSLKVAHCSDVNCSSAVFTIVDGPLANLASHTSLTIGRDGNPIISYYAGGANGGLKVAHCKDATCTKNSVYTLDSTTGVGTFTSISFGPDGVPLISYYNSNTSQTRILKCGVADCSSSINWPRDIAGTIAGGEEYSSITVGSDGLPVISYRPFPSGNLGIIKCGSENCVPYWTRR